MIVADKLAKVGKVQEEMTKAATNLAAANKIASDLILKTGNAALNKILVDLETASDANDKAIAAYKMAQNKCMPVVL